MLDLRAIGGGTSPPREPHHCGSEEERPTTAAERRGRRSRPGPAAVAPFIRSRPERHPFQHHPHRTCDPSRGPFPPRIGLEDVGEDLDDKHDHRAVRQPDKSPTTDQGEELFVMFPRAHP